MLKSDQQGFLIGEVLDVSKEMLAGQRAGLEVLSRIDANVSEMLRRPARSSRSRTADLASMLAGAAPVAEPPTRRGSPLIRPAGPLSAYAPTSLGRDSKGRFVKGAGGAGSGGGKRSPKEKSAPDEKPAPDEARVRGENRIVEAIKETAAASTDRMDPMIEAAKEVWEPLGRGWRASFGQSAEKKKERWYKRILKAITGKKKDEDTAAKGGGSGGGGSSMISGLLGGAASRFGGLLSGVPGLLGKAGTGIMGGAAGLLKRVPFLGAAGGVLKRIPLLGGLIAGGSALYSAFEDNDPSLSSEENKTKRYRGVGGALGMGAGGAAGAAIGSLLGPMGTIAGGALGAHLGEKAGAAIGEWAKDVPEKIAEISKSPVVSAVVESAKTGAAAAGQFVAENASKIVPDVIKKAAGMGANALSLMMEAIKGGISDPRKLAMFMGNMSHESGGFASLEEKFNYSPSRLMKVFGKKYFPTEQSANEAIAGGPERIADIVYGGRMGNSTPGDGYKFRGRGFIQLTGKDNYAAAGKAIGVDLLKNPDQAANPEIASKIAVWFWNKRVASRGMDVSVEASRKAINGGLNGLDDTIKRVDKFTSVFGTASAASAPRVSPTSAINPAALKSIAPAPDVSFGSAPHQEVNPVQRSESVSQNVSDRSIAHIATGGMGGIVG